MFFSLPQFSHYFCLLFVFLDEDQPVNEKDVMYVILLNLKQRYTTYLKQTNKPKVSLVHIISTAIQWQLFVDSIVFEVFLVVKLQQSLTFPTH